MPKLELPPLLCNRLKQGKAILFLGAGASFGSQNRQKSSPPLGEELKSLLANAVGMQIADSDQLSSVARVAQQRLGRVSYDDFLRKHYANCQASKFYERIAQSFWPRVYTTNIDDALDNAVRRYSSRPLRSINHADRLVSNLSTEEFVLIKLHGDVTRLNDGIIFSTEEYSKEANSLASWYQQVALDFSSFTFIFVGTKLNEPLFSHYIERLSLQYDGKKEFGSSFLICPDISELRREELKILEIEAMDGTADDFVDAVEVCLGVGYSSSDALQKSRPAYAAFIANLPSTQKEVLRSQADAILVLAKDSFKKNTRVGVRDFYYGNQPTWDDVTEDVPATLEFYDDIIDRLEQVVIMANRVGIPVSVEF